MEGTSRDAEEVGEEVTGRFKLLYTVASQMLGFGPLLASQMSIYSTMMLPWGLGAAGAETVKRGVDTENTEGIARMTAAMVKLGLLGTVHDIVVSLCAQDRADAVGSVTAGLLSLGEVWTVVQITNALVASGHTNEVMSISGNLLQQGNMQITEVLQEAGLDISSLTGGGGGKDDKKKEEEEEGSSGAGSSRGKEGGEGVMESIQKSAASMLDRVTPQQQKEAKKEKAPDADSLFSDWTGVKAEDAKGYTAKAPAEEDGNDKKKGDEEVPPKEERLL